MHKVQPHHRKNYERTDEALNEIRALITAYTYIWEQSPTMHADDPLLEAKAHLRNLIADRAEDLCRLHSMEWVGLGGVAFGLTEDEVAEASALIG